MVISSESIAVVTGHVPSAAEETIDGEVLSTFKFRGPALCLCHTNGCFTSTQIWCLINANGDPAVEFKSRVCIKQQRVDAVGEHTTEGVLVEAGGGVEEGGHFGITTDRTHYVRSVWSGNIEAISRHSRDSVERDDLLLEAIACQVAAQSGTAVIAGSILFIGSGHKVACRAVGTTGYRTGATAVPAYWIQRCVGRNIQHTVYILSGSCRAGFAAIEHLLSRPSIDSKLILLQAFGQVYGEGPNAISVTVVHGVAIAAPAVVRSIDIHHIRGGQTILVHVHLKCDAVLT